MGKNGKDFAKKYGRMKGDFNYRAYHLKGAVYMAMPTYEDIMLPFLQTLSDGKTHTLKELHVSLAEHFDLSDEERSRMLPSGNQLMFYNRLGWARTHLKKALLINSVGSGQFQISERGQNMLATSPNKITNAVLMKYPEFVSFWKPGLANGIGVGPGAEPETVCQTKTPRELIHECYQDLRNALADDLLQQVSVKSPVFFEHLVLDLLVRMGYGGSREDAAQVVGKSGDEGIDGIIKEDRLGLDVIYIQAKRWKSNVGSPEIQGFIGALQLKGAHKGIFITTSSFTPAAKDTAQKIGNRIVLIDGMQLAQLMIDFNVGVSVETNYEVKRVDQDYFSEE